MSNAGSAHAGGGAGAGKVNVQDLTFTKWVDKATPGAGRTRGDPTATQTEPEASLNDQHVQLRWLVTRLQNERDYCIDPGLIEKALLAAEESTRSG